MKTYARIPSPATPAAGLAEDAGERATENRSDSSPELSGGIPRVQKLARKKSKTDLLRGRLSGASVCSSDAGGVCEGCGRSLPAVKRSSASVASEGARGGKPEKRRSGGAHDPRQAAFPWADAEQAQLELARARGAVEAAERLAAEPFVVVHGRWPDLACDDGLGTHARDEKGVCVFCGDPGGMPGPERAQGDDRLDRDADPIFIDNVCG